MTKTSADKDPQGPNQSAKASHDKTKKGKSTKDWNSSRMVEDYLKHIHSAAEWGEKSFSVSQLAQQMGVAVSTASENIRRLAQDGLVKHEPYRRITLSTEGQRVAIAMVRKHRLLETYLVEKLNYRWDEVHEEADILEHAVSDRLIAHIDAALNFPKFDPHGDPIPAVDGHYEHVSSQSIAQAKSGKAVEVVRISDDNPQLLRFLKNVGIQPGVKVTPLQYVLHAGIMNVEVGGNPVALGQPAIEAIWVSKPAS